MSTATKPNHGIHWALWAAFLVLSAILAFALFSAWVHNLAEEKRKAWACLGCQCVATNIEAYVEHEANTKHELPTTFHDLVNPPFGGSSFLRNGEADLLDPWEKPYRFERRHFKDGREYPFIWTTAPDGTRISQFGIGSTNSEPR